MNKRKSCCCVIRDILTNSIYLCIYKNLTTARSLEVLWKIIYYLINVNLIFFKLICKIVGKVVTYDIRICTNSMKEQILMLRRRTLACRCMQAVYSWNHMNDKIKSDDKLKLSNYYRLSELKSTVAFKVFFLIGQQTSVSLHIVH